ncbi:MAG: L-rhamnose mutarotase [Planctomycetes bacterium]|nr:L-rhamnose mutarotase [Planctomycetota bacterium]MBM3992105.1 L-rhamnose mutarotase [Planctomycetota bacterium]
MKRYGMVIRLRRDKVEDYVRMHAAVWPSVLARISACNLRNYSIFLQQLDDARPYLFAYFEYTGSDFAADMARMAADPETQRWWKLTEPCQEPLAARAPGEWWTSMSEVFHHA